MASYGQLVKSKARGDPSSGKNAARPTRRAIRAQLLAQEEAKFFNDNTPLNILQEVENKAEDLWTKVKNMPKEDLHREVADWVLDPGSTAGRAIAYDYLLMQYWVNMKLVGHSYAEREVKMAGDEEPVREWKQYKGECHLMHQKMDILASRLGISFFAAGKDSDEVARPREYCGQCGKKKQRILSPAEASLASPIMPSAPAHPIGSYFPSAFQKQE